MNVLIAGGMGYIGSRLSVRMQQEKWHLTILDRDADNERFLLNKDTRIFTMDASDPLCEQIFADSSFDIVIHLACQVLPAEGTAEQSEMLHQNLSATENMLYLSRRSHAGKVIVLFDSCIYGESGDRIKTEASALNPDTAAGRQELLRAKLCEAYHRQGLDTVQLRTGLVYGPSMTQCPDIFELQHQALPVLAASAAMPDFASDTSEDVRIYPSVDKDILHNCAVDCVYINDLVEAIMRTCMTETSPVLNIACGRPVTLAQIRISEKKNWQKQARSTCCIPAMISGKYVPQDSEIRSGYCLDYSLASFELGWVPRFTLECGLEATVRHQAGASDKIALPAEQKLQSQAVDFSVPATSVPRKYTRNKKARPAIVSGLFIVAVSLDFLMRYRLGSGFDMLIPFMLLICSLYGSKEGYFAAGLAAVSRLGFLFLLEDTSLLRFFNGVDGPLTILFYFLLTMAVCRITDRGEERQQELEQEIRRIRKEKEYLNVLYRSSLKVKETLQRTIAETKESFSRIQYVLNQFHDAPPSRAGDITVKVVAEILRTPSVSLYNLDPTGEFLQKIAGDDPQQPALLRLQDHTFLAESVRRETININTAMEACCPLVCAPIPTSGSQKVLIFLDGIELVQLNQYYLNTLNSLLQLVAHYLKPRILESRYHSDL